MNGNTKNNAETQLQVAIGILLESVGDKSTAVSETVKCSIKKLAEKHPNQVLISCMQYCYKTPKPSNHNISIVLHIMETVCVDYIINIDGDTVLACIEFGMKTMVENVNSDPQIQMPASGILVALGRQHYVQVMDSLMAQMKPGVIPHFMIPHTLGALASNNAICVVPYFKDILPTILPLLNGLRSDSLKLAFSYALGSFCEALQEYVSNTEQVPDSTITIEYFNSDMGHFYDVLFQNWLYSKDNKVVENVLNALAAMYPILSIEKVTQQTIKMVQVLLNMYKRLVDPFVITKCLGAVIKITANVNGTLLEPLLPNILNSLSDLVNVSHDYAQPDLLKSHAEVLRCYECFALHFTDHTIDQILTQMKNNNEKDRIKALTVITHLIAYSGEQTISRRYKDILKQMTEVMGDPNIRVKKALMKIIVALACKKVLLNKDITPDGPEKYIEFILRMCCKQVVPKNCDIQTDELYDIQKSADNTIYMLSTSVAELEPILWMILTNCLLDPHYEDAVVIIIRCLTHLASKKDVVIGCEEIFIRCLTFLSTPLLDFRGTFVLNFLKNIKLCDDENYKNLWDTKIMQLCKYLEQNYDNFNNENEEWQGLLFDFLNLILESIKNESFNQILIANAKKQLAVYNHKRNSNVDNTVDKITKRQSEKLFLLKILAMILCYIKEKDIIVQTLDNILLHVKLQDINEINACAEAIGIVSRNHLQLVLDKLHLIRKDILLKKSSKFFSFMKDQKHELSIERLRYLVICSYGEVCNEAPSDILLKIIESEILDFVKGELTHTKDFTIRKVCLKTIGAAADAMHPNRNTLHIRLNDRNKIIELVSSQMQLHSGPEHIELFPIIIPTITALIRLPLPLESQERLKLLKLFFDNVFNASAIYCKIKSETCQPGENYYGDLKLVPFITKSFTELNQFVSDLLIQNISPSTLDEIVTMLEPWLAKKKAEQRLPALETLRLVLQNYLENMKFAYDCPNSFGQTGFLLAWIIPRCTDPNKNIRKVAVESIVLVLCIAARYEGHMRDHDKQLSNQLQNIQQKIDTEEPKLLYNLTADLAHIICLNLPQFQLIHFVDGLIQGLMDYESSSSTGCSVILTTVLKNKGSELQPHVGAVLEKLLVQLEKITCIRTKSSAIRGILHLGTHHSKIVGAILLDKPLPLDHLICDCWAILSSDQTLAQDLIDQLKKIIKQTTLYEEEGETKIANLQALQALCAMHELLKNSHLKEICLQQFPELFSLLLVCCASFVGVQPPVKMSSKNSENKYGFIINRDAYKISPQKIALDTFRLFLNCCQYQKMSAGLLNFKQTDTTEVNAVFLDLVATLVENVCHENPQSLSWLVACLGPYIRADLEPQRIVVIAFFTNLIKHKTHEQSVLVENLLEMILDVQADQSCTVRMIGLQGLGYAAEYLNSDLISRHCNTIISVLMNSLDYNNIGNESLVILEGMLSFSKLLNALENFKFSSFQVTAAVRIKPLLGQEDVNLRKASFRLLGDLTQSLNSDANLEAFKEQIHGNLISLLLHLCDPDMYVIKASKYTLRKIGPYLDSPKVNKMIQEHLIDEANLHYAHFIRDLIKIMGEELQDLFPLLIMTSISYLKSQWVEIRSNAALVVGLLYSQLTAENRPRVSLDTVCDRLMRLLNDDSEDVKMRAVQSIAYLFLH